MLSWVVPDSHTLRHLINKKYEELQPKVKSLLKSSDSKKSYTTDGWSSNQMDPYLSLSCHFIDDKFKYWDILLDLAPFPHPHDQFNSSSTVFEVKYIVYLSNLHDFKY